MSIAGAELAGTAAFGDVSSNFPEMKKNVHPGENFYDFANGGWHETAELKAGERSAGASGEVRARVDRQSQEIMRDLLAASHAPGSDEAKFLNVYRSFRARSRRGTSLRPLLTYIDRAETHRDIAGHLGDFRLDAGGWVEARVRIDPLGGAGYVASIEPSILLFGSRHVYLDPHPAVAERRAAGEAALVRIMRAIGHRRQATARVRAVLALETELARLYPDAVTLRDAHQSAIFMTVEELAEAAPGFDWSFFLERRGFSAVGRVQIALGGRLKALSMLFAETPVAVWQDYLRLRLAQRYGAYLSGTLSDRVEVLNALRRGVEVERLPRRERARKLAQSLMPDVIARAWADAHVDEQILAEVQDMAEQLRAAYRERIAAANWLSPETRQRALTKLEAIKFIVGRPPGWNDYYNYEPGADSPFGNAYWKGQIIQNSALARLNRPADRPRPDLETLRSHVFFSPQQIGAYYLPRLNTIIIPAAYLQAPYYDRRADMALNYGALGTTLGHEIGHAFDDQGSKYGPEGQLEDWWTPEDRARFEAIGAGLSAQFSDYEAAPGVKVNVALTLGENLSDLAGLDIAYLAYRKALAGDAAAGDDDRAGDAARGAQLFFLGYAHKRRTLRRPELVRELAAEDPHSPPVHRVNGIVRNVDAWYEAFGIGQDSALWLAPEDRVRVW